MKPALPCILLLSWASALPLPKDALTESEFRAEGRSFPLPSQAVFISPSYRQVRRQGRKGDSPPLPKPGNGLGLRGPGGKNDLTTEDIEAKILEVNSRLGAHSAFDIANPVIVSIKTSPKMKAQLLDQEIESQLLVEFAPKLVKVVFNDGPNPVETRSSGGPIVSFAVDEGGVMAGAVEKGGLPLHQLRLGRVGDPSFPLLWMKVA